MLDAAARRYRLDPRLVREVAWQESGFDPRSVSDKGAMGVMQLMPETARILGVTDPFDPRQNIDGGTRYLRDLLHLYRGDIRLSLAAYNAGPAVVAHYGNRIPPFNETRDYVRVITRRLRADGVRVARPARSEAIVLTGRDATGALVYSDVQ
ncbi:MAG TPA: lytic transglycosylase domain-containing protein [Terriglobales bacterium]|nr:lytic transglycosylase domain-containing protein [Terriglobales bacterium]